MRICVYCGSRFGNGEVYVHAARQMGKALADRGIDLVYGGGRVGLMGAIADAALQAGGTVLGVIPQSLVDREIQHTGLTQLHVVATMHERKAKMAELADAFIALPGGAGTLEEIFEQWTWGQLGIHHKPCGFLNTNGYFDSLRKMVDTMAGEGFLHPEYVSMLTFHAEPTAIIDAFRLYSPPLPKWQTVSKPVIRIVAALVQDDAGRVLLVRKRGTRAFMQPGGKLRDSESHPAALERELKEELGCSVRPGSPAFLGTFLAPPANETGCMVEAALYRVEVVGTVSAAAEIEEIAWVRPEPPHQIELAPLTRESVLPLAARSHLAAQTRQ
ncbi:MAG TPA: TIGR00730 family Rossman fold protein [Bryobacteraceae bacterium]|nr:TIGR00730 family Rossman fold protein [Bryobacteraceae bacterium]